MPPQSRGNPNLGNLQSKSTPTLPTLRSLNLSLSNDLVDAVPNASPTAQTHNPPVKDDPSSDARLQKHEDNVHPSHPPEVNGSDSSSNEDESAFTVSERPSHTRLQLSRSHTHLSPRLTSSNSGLFPPFYNRPPTPLPPSPSLTSLLRPFSTQSRPTTPDSSDIEVSSHVSGSAIAPSSTAAAVARSARTATTVPRASPKVPTYEYYGFALYVVSSAAFLMYLLWAFLPSPFLHQLGIHYYPNRWWALAVPAWCIMAVAFTYIALASYNIEVLTHPLRNVENLVDECGQIAEPDWKEKRLAKAVSSDDTLNRWRSTRKGKKASSAEPPFKTAGDYADPFAPEHRDWRELWSESTDAVMDVPVGGVCEILYGECRESDDDSSDGNL